MRGQLQVDNGACKALLKRQSLLAVGMVKVIKSFDAGEVFEIVDLEYNTIAVAKSKIDANVLSQLVNKQNIEIAHADDIVLI